MPGGVGGSLGGVGSKYPPIPTDIREALIKVFWGGWLSQKQCWIIVVVVVGLLFDRFLLVRRP